MGDVKAQVINKKYTDKTWTINQFAEHMGITPQAVNYALKHELIDYMRFSRRIRIIVGTKKTMNYDPNNYPRAKKDN